jgi:hypothetical protein
MEQYIYTCTGMAAATCNKDQQREEAEMDPMEA